MTTQRNILAFPTLGTTARHDQPGVTETWERVSQHETRQPDYHGWLVKHDSTQTTVEPYTHTLPTPPAIVARRRVWRGNVLVTTLPYTGAQLARRARSGASVPSWYTTDKAA